MRPFAPISFAVQPEDFFTMIEDRLRHSGEYVFHMPDGLPRQAVVMNHQFIPVEASLGSDFVVGGNNPLLFGLRQHFENAPKIFKEGNSVKPDSGSQFEVRGILYNVKKVDVNHRGYMRVELVQNDKCVEVRADFATEVEAFLCSSETNCADT